MNTVFADSYYYLAFVNDRDSGHERAVDFSRSYRGCTLTTEWVLTEVADALSAPEQRGVFLELLAQLRDHAGLTIVEASHELFDRGITLFSQRPDKSWSLTDCISIVAMQQHGIQEALTADHHFQQAGFILLLQSTELQDRLRPHQPM
jgi:predicted nucleic acid-binding protein